MYRLVTSQFKVGLAVSVIGYISVMLVVAEVGNSCTSSTHYMCDHMTELASSTWHHRLFVSNTHFLDKPAAQPDVNTGMLKSNGQSLLVAVINELRLARSFPV